MKADHLAILARINARRNPDLPVSSLISEDDPADIQRQVDDALRALAADDLIRRYVKSNGKEMVSLTSAGLLALHSHTF